MTDKIMAIIATIIVAGMFAAASWSAFKGHDRFTAIAAAIGSVLTIVCFVYLWRAAISQKDKDPRK